MWPRYAKVLSFFFVTRLNHSRTHPVAPCLLQRTITSRKLPSPSSRLLHPSEHSGRELSEDHEVATLLLPEGLPNPCNAVLLPKRAHAIQVQSVEFQDLAYFSSNSSALLCRLPRFVVTSLVLSEIFNCSR